MTTINKDWWAAINGALADGTPCLLGTVSGDGEPQISPKGSILVHDANNLAFWERSKRTALDNIHDNNRVERSASNTMATGRPNSTNSERIASQSGSPAR